LRADSGDVSAFLSNLLTARGIKPTGVLKAAGLYPTNLHDAFAVRALFQAAEPYLPETIATDTDTDGTDRGPTLKRHLPLLMIKFSFFSLYVYCGKLTGIVFMIFLSLYVFLRFLTWGARHSQPLFATRRFFFVISEPLQD